MIYVPAIVLWNKSPLSKSVFILCSFVFPNLVCNKLLALVEFRHRQQLYVMFCLWASSFVSHCFYEIGKMWLVRYTVGVYFPHGLLFRYGNGKEMAQTKVLPRILETQG